MLWKPDPSERGVAMANNPHASWFLKYEWDFDAIPTGGEFGNYMRALLCCANGDGQLQPGEREWVVGYAGNLGVPPTNYSMSYAATQPTTTSPN
jgi:hypothetical protein